MSGITDWFHNTVKQVTGKTPQEHADAITSALPVSAKNAMTDSKVTSALGAAPEPAGMTMTGGRRKTCGGKRRGKKTLRGGKRRR
jgi:hypothetical protein